MGFGDLELALRARDLIESVAKSVVDRERPRYRYGSVTTIDRVNYTCGVRFTGDTVSTPVQMGSIQPQTIGQTVRVAGIGNDKYLDEVLGPSYISGVTLIGELKAWPMPTAPAGYLLCNKTSLLRSDYPDLATALGHPPGGSESLTLYWGAADANHFYTPDLLGKVLVGFDSSQTEFNAIGLISGEKSHVLSVAEMPAHTHQLRMKSDGSLVANSLPSYVSGSTWDFDPAGPFGGTGTGTHGTASAGSGNAHNNLQPYAVGNYIIKY